MELHHDKHHGGYVKNANATLDRLERGARPRRTFDDLGRLSKGRSRSTCRATCCTRSSGRTWRRRAGGSRKASWPSRSRRTSATSSSLKKQHQRRRGDASWARAGAPSSGSRSAALLVTQIYDHQSNITQAGIPSSCSTRGSTRSTCSTKTARPTSSTRLEPVELGGRGRALRGARRLELELAGAGIAGDQRGTGSSARRAELGSG